MDIVFLPISGIRVICIEYTTIPVKGTSPTSVTIDWGDGNMETDQPLYNNQKCHTYQNHGSYIITIIAIADGVKCGSGSLPLITV